MRDSVAKIVSILSLIFLVGCSALAPIAGKALLGGAEKGIDVDANVAKGDAEGEESVAQNANTAVSVQVKEEQQFENVETVLNEAGLKPYELLLLVLLAGWAIPSPRQMFLGIFGALREAMDRLTGRRT